MNYLINNTEIRARSLKKAESKPHCIKIIYTSSKDEDKIIKSKSQKKIYMSSFIILGGKNL